MSIRAVINHLLAGAGLGCFLALSVLIGNAGVFKTLAASAFPQLSVLAFVAVSSVVIAVGSAITGFIICASEQG